MIEWRKIYTFLWLGAALLSALSPAGAQLPGMRKYTQQDGFTATSGFEFEQDERGFLWIGTDNGGMSFDGKKFRVLLDKDDFPDAEILAIRPLSYDRVLLIPISHSLCYLDKGKLVTEKEDPRLSATHNPNHNVTRRDPATQSFWLSDGRLLTKLFRFSGNAIEEHNVGNTRFTIENVIGNCFIGGLIDTQKKATYACIYNMANGAYYYCYDEAGKQLLPNQSFMNAGSDKDYLVTYYTKAREVTIFKYRANDSLLQRVKKFNLAPGNYNPTVLTLDHNKALWAKFVGKEGLWYYGNVLENPGDNPFHIGEPGLVNSIYIDRNSNLWMSSQNNALYFISRKHFRNALLTRRFPLKKEVPKYISGDGKGRLLISYVNNTNMADVDGGRSRVVTLDKAFSEGSRGILPIDDHRFLVFQIQSAIYDMSNHTFTYLKSFGLNYKDVCVYREKDLLIAESHRVVLLSSYQSQQPEMRIIFNGRSMAIGVMSDGRILIGTPTGLYSKQSLWADAVRVKDTLIDQCNITDIQPLPGGAALIGTNAKGLFLYKADRSLLPVKIDNLKLIRSIYKQNDSFYWACTNHGVYTIIFKPGWSVSEIRNYTFYDGLPSNNATSIYVHQDTAYVATSEGIGVLPLKDSTLLKMAPPDIYLNTLQADTTLFWYPDSLVTLSRKQNDLLLSLSAISYESLGNIQYYYRLHPLQTQWIRTTEPDIRFNQLPPGKYTFQACALNAKGDPSKIISLAIDIQPAFWQTLIFKVALLALALMGFYLLLRWWLLRRERKKYVRMQDKKRLAELELEAIKAQINPHFIYNCLNSIQYLNYKMDHQQAQQYLDLFARLIRMTMQYSRQAFIPLSEEVDYLSLYLQLEKLRFKDKLQYTIHTDQNVNKEALIPSMLVQPYVENALKHGIAGREKGELHIRFGEKERMLQITVQDDGPGFSGLKRPGALGLRIAGTRATSYNELFDLDIEIRCSNRQDKHPALGGAEVMITMPYVTEAASIKKQ